MIPAVSVIVSTYNQPEWLEKVLISYTNQLFTDFEILIADDGSKKETGELIETFQRETSLSITHVWHEDKGFRKNTILNKAITQSQSDYLIFTDGDCIARKDFIQKHVEKRKSGYFLSGGYFKLPMSLSKKITKEDILTNTCFKLKWLYEQGLPYSFKTNKLNAHGLKEDLLNMITPTKLTFNGMNSSAWKEDILKVNGFDERMYYGAEDRELGDRLINNGIKGKQIRYSAICLHLDHARGYIESKQLEENLKIWKNTQKEKKTWTDFGIIPSTK